MTDLDTLEWIKRLRLEASERAEQQLGWAITGHPDSSADHRERAAYASGEARAYRIIIEHLTPRSKS